LSSVARLGLALLLLWSAWHKLRDLRAFRVAIAGYALLPAIVVPAVALIVAGAESALGIGLLGASIPTFGSGAPVSALPALGSAMLLSVYTGAIVINLGRGRTRIDCGCGGPAGALPLGRALVVRNALLILVALAASLPRVPRALGSLDAVVVLVATGTFACLYGAAETALANVARWRTRQGRHLPVGQVGA
jgi:hypothetical protein